MLRESNGAGTFRITKAGRFEYRMPYYDVNGIRRTKSFTTDSKRECLDRADDFLRQLQFEAVGVDRMITIPKLLYDKIENDYRKNYTGEQGYDRNLATVRIIEKQKIGRMPIMEIQKEDIEGFLWYITKYSNTVIGKVYAMLKKAFEMASDERIIEKNIMKDKDLRKPNSNKLDKKVRGFSEEEQSAYVQVLKKHQPPFGRNDYKKQLLIELYTGMRMGEINALTPEDIDFKNRLIRVNKTVSRGRKCRAFLSNTTKTKAGEREVPISRIVEPILREAILEIKENPYHLIFYDYIKDGLVETSQVNSFHRRMCEKAGVPHLGQHALRHTFATRCIEADVPAITLKNWLGHTDIHITLDVYADVFSRMNLKSIAKYETLMDTVMKECEEGLLEG